MEAQCSRSGALAGRKRLRDSGGPLTWRDEVVGACKETLAAKTARISGPDGGWEESDGAVPQLHIGRRRHYLRRPPALARGRAAVSHGRGARPFPAGRDRAPSRAAVRRESGRPDASATVRRG